MESDLRYQWLEKVIVSCLNAKKEALVNLLENEDNKLVILEFLNNEDIKQIYIYLKSSNQIYASRNCSVEGEYEKGIYFLKISNTSKLTADKMSTQVAYFESSIRIFDHMDLMTREVFMPLLCAADNLPTSLTTNNNSINSNHHQIQTVDQADKLMDVMHRIISQIAIAQSHAEDSVTLPLPSLSVLATAAINPNRRLTVLHILETTLINWQKQIKNALKQQPEIDNIKSNFYTKDEIQLWTSCINKLNNLIVQLDAQHVKDILMNLENNNSSYVQPFNTIKNDIKASIKSAEINLRYISTLTPWVHKIKTANLIEEAQYLFTGLFHTLLLIWQHSKYYHLKDRFAHMLLFLSNEVVSVSKQVVGENILQDPLRSYNKLKEALRICAMFRGTYLDFKEKADALNAKFHKLEKKIDFNEKQLWWVQLYSSEDHLKLNETNGNNDEYDVMRQNSPWPKRNHNCFFYLNVFMERCNDVLELVQTMRHFQILSKTVSIGGSDNQNMDILAQEIHIKYEKAINEFQYNVMDVMNFDELTNKNFELSFFHLRTTIKELERELSQILNLSIKHCTTIGAKLRLLQVFEGVHERDVIQDRLNSEYSWLINELLKEFSNVRQLCTNSKHLTPSIMPSIANKLFWYHGLEQRIKTPMDKFSYLYPNLLQGDVGYHLRDSYRQTIELIDKCKKEAIESWQKKISSSLTDKLQQTIFKNVSIEDMVNKRPSLIEVNLDFELEKTLKEIRYLSAPPLNIDLTHILKDKFNNINDEKQLILYATRARLIADKYNLIMKNIQPEELPLFEMKLNRIDSVIELGLGEYTWNSVEIPDYIEKAHSIICTDVYQNLELINQNSQEIFSIVNSWCDKISDVFKNRDLTSTRTAKELEKEQAELDESIRKDIIRGGNRIHSLIGLNLNAVETSEASPGWQEYINFTNEVIYNGFKISTLQSLRNMFHAMSDPIELKMPFVCINLELVDNKLLFSPPLDENSHIKNLQEVLFDFINTFISRGSYMNVLGKNRTNFDQMVANDEATFDLVSKINESIEKTSLSCRKIFDYFNLFSYLWTGDIHIAFSEFLKGSTSLSRGKQKRPPSKNFMSNRNAAKSIASLGSMLTPEAISNIERTFLSPYYHNLPKHEKDLGLTPLLEDFDSEIGVYVSAREKILKLENYQDVSWIRVNLQPTIDVLVTLTNKLVWKFTSFLSNQIKVTLNELDQFLKRMEPDIENITGEERDTATFMKIMRIFNEVSSKQQEMEIKFELMKKTIDLLKKYERFDVFDLEMKFNQTPVRWSNLKSKVTLAKQRLGPTIQEESKLIITDLKQFSIVINDLYADITESYLFNTECDPETSAELLAKFLDRLNNLQNKADDLKQLQELLESDIVDFEKLIKSRKTLVYLEQLWKSIGEIRKKHDEWKLIRWQKVNIKLANEETDKQLDLLANLTSEIQKWDIYLNIKREILNIKNCLPIIEEIANPAMRTRHWKNLVRISGGTALVDNETLKMLTFGQLIDLNLHMHVDEVKQIVQKAIKDLSIEQTIKTYEEIWLSKIFDLKKYKTFQCENPSQTIFNGNQNDEDDKSSHDRRSSFSRIGVIQASSTTKSNKRLSIGSLPNSLIGLEPLGENEPVYLFENAESLFAELEHHQIVLQELLMNQSAGSFYDEIIKWQTTLQNIEAVLKVWNLVQNKWKRIESAYSMYDIQTILPQESILFFKGDRDFKVLMKATHKNSNILKCCQRKNILNILKHLNQNFGSLYESLLQEMSKKRQKCPRLYLLNDEDLIDLICCGSNLENLSQNIHKSFDHIKSLRFETNQLTNETSIIGFYDKNMEYLPLKPAIIYKGIVEDFVNEFENAIKQSLKYLLDLALNGNVPPTPPTQQSSQSTTDWSNNSNKSTKVLASIKESTNELSEFSSGNHSPSIQFSWIFQHVTQIIDISLRILFTNQIETCLKDAKLDELKKLESKLGILIEFYMKEMSHFEQKLSKNHDTSAEKPNETKSGIIMNENEQKKIQIIINITIYYRNLCKLLISENVNSIQSPKWLSKLRYYLKNDEESSVVIKTLNDKIEFNYGFQYYSRVNYPSLIYEYDESNEIENLINNFSNLLHHKSNLLIYGPNHKKEIIDLIGNLFGYETHYFFCSENTTSDSLANICKSLVISGYLITFLNLNNLTSKLMTSLSNVLTQINERKKEIQINNESYNLFKPTNTNDLFAYFAIIQDNSSCKSLLTNSAIDSLKITKIDNCLNTISKDLLEKFQTIYLNVNLNFSSNKNYFISNGFRQDNQLLSKNLLKLNDLYKNLLRVLTKNSQTDFIDTTLTNYIIEEASKLIYERNNNKYFSSSNLSLDQIEQNSLAVCFCNKIMPRLDLKSSKMLLNYLKMIWPSLVIKFDLENFDNNDDKLNSKVYMEKETAMQLDDKLNMANVEDAVCVATQKLKLAPSFLFQTKVINLTDVILNSNSNILLVGQSGYGKTSLIKTAFSTLSELGHFIDKYHIYINSFSNDDLFGLGESNNNSKSMNREGLISNTLKNFSKKSQLNFIHLIGESNETNFSFYESLFLSNQCGLFLNQNSEKQHFSNNDRNKFKLIWETDDLSNLSPQIISKSNLVYLSESLTKWQHLIHSMQCLNDSQLDKKLKDELYLKLKMIKEEFDSKPNDYKDVLPVKFESKVRLCLSLMKSLIKNNDNLSIKNVEPLAEYCVSIGCSAAFTKQSRHLFDQYCKSKMITLPKDADRTIYDFFYDLDSNQYQLWSDNIPSFSCPVHQGIPLNVFVHTPSTMFVNSMLDVMMNLDESFLIAGETGCGKTALISDKLKTSCSGDLTELFSITINSNRLTNSNYLHSRINHHLTWIHGSKYVPKGNKRMYCFIDDIHQSQIDENMNRQSAVEFLRQHLDSEKIYDLTNKKWQHVKNVTYITTFNYKSYSPSSSKSNKILKHFHVVAQHFPSNSETHGIYTKLLYRHFIGDIENESSNNKLNLSVSTRLKNLQSVIKNIIQTSIDLNQKMRSLFLEKTERLHYIFTMRILTSLFRHICLSLTPDCTKEQLLLLWHHECDWLYGQRMIDNVDVERYKLAYKTVVKQNFNDQNELEILNRNVYFSNLKETESGIVLAGLAANGYQNSSANSNTNNNENSSNTNSQSNSNGSNTSESKSTTANSSNNVITDNYEATNDLNQIRKLIKISLNEYNKEQQRIVLPLYESTLSFITRLTHTTQCVGGNCCIVADGGISPFVLQLVASLMQYNLISFKMSQYMYSKESFFQQLKHKLVNSYYKAGIKGEKIMICLTEEEMSNKEFLTYITEFLITEEVMHLFTIEEETTILNSIRTQVIQSGFVYTRETAWEFFVKNIRENTRIIIVLNENSNKFQSLNVEYSSLFNNMELIWIQNWGMKQLVSNALYHFNDIQWLDNSSKENLAHLLASMHYSIRENDTTKSSHLNNKTYTKFVEKFKTLLINKYKEIEFSHKDTCRLLEHIQKEHTIAKKLLSQLQQDCMVLEERIDSTNKMLQQIGQDMTMTEQQLKVHHLQTKKTVQLKRILPEYQSAHERNVYKTVAIIADTKKLIQNINMNSLQELRTVQKPDSRMEDILAAIIMILKSPTADVTWQKGAKRQMANLDRFLEELQTFDEHEIAENTIKLLEDFVLKIDSYELNAQQKQMPYYDALQTLDKWIRGVLRYHMIMLKKVRPLFKKVKEIEKEVQEADQKLMALNRKSEALNARLTDLAQNFEEATVDKQEQEEKVIKMKQQLQTASELNTTLSREFDRSMQIYESLQERIFCLPGACALSAGFLIYLGSFDFRFRRLMLTGYWIKCLNDRGLPLVLDSISLIKGRTIRWQMESLVHLLPFANEINVPMGEGWVLNYVSETNLIEQQPFIGAGSSTTDESVINNNDNNNSEGVKIVINEPSPNPVENKSNDEIHQRNTPIKLTTTANLNNEQSNQNETIFGDESLVKMENSVSPVSEADEEFELVNTSSYRRFIQALIQYIIGEDQSLEWMSNDATGLELENGTIIATAEKYPPLIYDPLGSGTNWIINKITESIIDLDIKNGEDLLTIEKSFQNGSKIFYSNCKEIDSILLPLIYYKNAKNMDNMDSGVDDSKLVLFSNRRLFCNPTFQMYFETPNEFSKFSPNILTCTTPISYKPSVENFIDQFQYTLFELLFPDEYKKRINLLNLIRESNEKLRRIDEIMKLKWENEGFRENEISITKLALQRKYKIGEILDYCQEYLNKLNDLMNQLTPLAIRASLLMILSIKMNAISKNYEFSLNLIEFIFINLPSLVKSNKKELKLKNEINDDSENNETNEETKSQNAVDIEKELPELPKLDDLKDSKEINNYNYEDVDKLIKYLTNSFLNSVIISLLPEHRLYLLTLICFYIKSGERQDFTDLELEFLIRGKYNSNLNISLTDFGLPKSINKPEWIPNDNWNDLLAMSLLQGELDHFVVAVVSAEKEWKKWYDNPYTYQMPKIEMETEKTNKTEIVELNEFRKLILSKVLRPDVYIQFLNDYVKNSLNFELTEPNWNFVFMNPLYKSVIINMGSQGSNISNTSSMSRIHKNLFEIAKNNKQKITAFNCNYLTLTELRVEIKNVKEGFVLLKNAHLASSDIIEYIKSLCHLVNNEAQNGNENAKFRLLLTKSFDHVLPMSITWQSLQVSFDVIDIIAHNSSDEKNRKLFLDTCLIRPETYIFNCLQSSLNLIKNDDIANICKNFEQDKQILAYFICLVQGLLQSRQNIVCNALTKSYPWGVSSLKQAFIVLNQYESKDFDRLPNFLVENVYSNFLDDRMDKDYVINLIKSLLNAKSSKNVTLNGISLPIPDKSLATNQYANWLEETIPERKIDSKILQLHEQQIIYYNSIRAEDFIENLQQLWESNSVNSIKLGEELQQDWLFYSVKLCNERLPGLLPKIVNKNFDFKPENAVSFSLYREYELFNQQMSHVRNDLLNIEKYLLLNTQLFPAELKQIALTLQSQRVPNDWEHQNCQPSVHTLKSWIQTQTIRYNQLFEFYKSNFANIHSIKCSILKEPRMFFTCVLLEQCAKKKFDQNDCEICFDIKSEHQLDSMSDGIILLDMKIINGKFDSNKKSIKKSESILNKLPPVYVYVEQKTSISNSKTNQKQLNAYMNNLRQYHIMNMNFNINYEFSDELIPYIAFDTGVEEFQSRRLHKPIITNLVSAYQQSTMESMANPSKNNINAKNDESSNTTSLSAAYLSVRQPLSRTNNRTLLQIREVSTALAKSPESQLSYKPMSQNAPPLPNNLAQTMVRSKPLN